MVYRRHPAPATTQRLNQLFRATMAPRARFFLPFTNLVFDSHEGFSSRFTIVRAARGMLRSRSPVSPATKRLGGPCTTSRASQAIEKRFGRPCPNRGSQSQGSNPNTQKVRLVTWRMRGNSSRIHFATVLKTLKPAEGPTSSHHVRLQPNVIPISKLWALPIGRENDDGKVPRGRERRSGRP